MDCKANRHREEGDMILVLSFLELLMKSDTNYCVELGGKKCFSEKFESCNLS